jgi:hypothetical protein
METVTKYLEAIDEINKADRQLRRQVGASRNTQRLQNAYDAAEAAWRQIPPELKRRLSPPPDRETGT